MNTKVIVEIDSDLLRELQSIAGQTNISASAFLAQHLAQLVLAHKEQLEQEISRQRNYAEARERALARLQEAKPRGWKRPASRDELHER